MRHKHVIETYNSIIRQITKKIGKKVNICDPYGSNNIIIKDYEVTQDIFERLIKRRDTLLGGEK